MKISWGDYGRSEGTSDVSRTVFFVLFCSVVLYSVVLQCGDTTGPM